VNFFNHGMHGLLGMKDRDFYDLCSDYADS
jgi:hypothetical protein